MSVFDRRNGSTRKPLDEVDDVRAAGLWSSWRSAEIECGLALDGWYQASKGKKAHAFALYMDALDREEQAAEALALPSEGSAGSGVDKALAVS